MDSGQSTKHHHPAPIKVRAPRLAGIQFSEDSVTNELRRLFLHEVERATPEVLEKLRQKVWPEYIKAYDAIQHSGFSPTSVFFPSQSAARQEALPRTPLDHPVAILLRHPVRNARRTPRGTEERPVLVVLDARGGDVLIEIGLQLGYTGRPRVPSHLSREGGPIRVALG